MAFDPPKVADQVRLLARALEEAIPRGCGGRITVFETVGPGSTPGRGTEGSQATSSECAGFAHDFAKVGDQVRFLARTYVRVKMRRLGIGEPSWP
jgi:hypothetical protein